MKSLADQSRNFKSHKLCHAEEKRKNAGLSVRKKKMKHGSFNNTLSSPRPNHDAA
jgi:hypothetical protein